MRLKQRIQLLFAITTLLTYALPRAYAQVQGQQKYQKLYPGTVIGERAVVYTQPNLNSSKMAKLKYGDRVFVVSQTRDWYRVRITLDDGLSQDGWAEKTTIKLVGSRTTSSEALAPQSTQTMVIQPKRKSSGAEQDQEETQGRGDTYIDATDQSFSVKVAPVFNLYRFGASQTRLGAIYHIDVTSLFYLGIPFSYSKGGGFYSLQGGLDLGWIMVKWSHYSFIQRTGLYFERFAGNGKSFVAGTVDLGFGVQYHRGWFLLGIEPVSVEIVPIASNGIPWNVRAQVLFDIGARW